MTGFGRGEEEWGDGRIIVELKSVNHRFLEIKCRAPRELLAQEVAVEKAIKKQLSRGYLTANISYEGKGGGASPINQQALSSHLQSLLEVGEQLELCLSDLVPVLAAAPDLYTVFPIADEAFDRSMARALDEALRQLLNMRDAEGEAMAEQLKVHADTVQRAVLKLEALAEEWPGKALERLESRLTALLGDRELAIDQGRLETEVTLLADRYHFAEEIVRLKSHLDQLDGLLGATSPVGRKAEFLLQEMGREIHTISAKAQMSEVSGIAVDIKGELEKMRELAQNIE